MRVEHPSNLAAYSGQFLACTPVLLCQHATVQRQLIREGVIRDPSGAAEQPTKPAVQELRPLAYPLCQIMVGAIKLKPTARYYTLHLRLMRSLIHLGGATRLLMPVVPMLLDMLKWTALSKRVSAGASAPQQGAFLLRASKAVLTTPAFQADIIQQVCVWGVPCQSEALLSMSSACPGQSVGPLHGQACSSHFMRLSIVKRSCGTADDWSSWLPTLPSGHAAQPSQR